MHVLLLDNSSYLYSNISQGLTDVSLKSFDSVFNTGCFFDRFLQQVFRVQNRSPLSAEKFNNVPVSWISL